MPLFRAVLDGNVLDYLADDLDALALVRAAKADGALVLLGTHILRDELNAITEDGEKWARLEAVRGVLGLEEVPTTGLVLDVSRLDQATLLSWDDVDTFTTLSADNPKHAEDALLAMTAWTHGAVLVTQDLRLRARANANDVEALSAEDFIARLTE